MRKLGLMLLAITLTLLTACADTPDSQVKDGGENASPADLLLRLTEDHIVARIGDPVQIMEASIDAPRADWDVTLATWYEYAGFTVVFNLNGKSARVEAKYEELTVKPQAFGLGLSRDQIRTWLGEPIDKIARSIDAPRNEWSYTQSITYRYQDFDVVFNLNNVVMRIDGRFSDRSPLD